MTRSPGPTISHDAPVVSGAPVVTGRGAAPDDPVAVSGTAFVVSRGAVVVSGCPMVVSARILVVSARILVVSAGSVSVADLVESTGAAPVSGFTLPESC